MFILFSGLRDDTDYPGPVIITYLVSRITGYSH